MRIGFYAPLKPPDHPSPSGDRRMARLLIAALSGMGHDVQVISDLRSYNSDGNTARETSIAAAARDEVQRLTGVFSGPPPRLPDLLFTYHVYHKAADYIGPALKHRFNIPYVIAEPSVAPKRANGPWAKGYAQAALAIRSADALLCLTTLDRACVIDLAGADKVIALPPFLEAAPYARVQRHRAELRPVWAAQYRLPADEPWLLAVGMMRQGDKLASFRALAEMLKQAQDIPWRLIVAGDGPAREEVEAVMAPLGGRVCFTGLLAAEQLAGAYTVSDLYVWPAVNEAYGMALLEAQACGLPVLAAQTRGVPDIVRQNETGLLTPEGDMAAMADGLRSLLADLPALGRMRDAALAKVSAEHDLAAAQRNLTQVFRNLGLPA
ncbi:glycosyltransferase family 4 protein [Ferrovibrio sp.]|uniref:glycosyltransferase family 4 protein n=1 Tax=Ferrovibrio sp. TaxID=1917215 RepID=UPI0025B96F84|nr:glycosyltransferase family 4 protein [Ferrovibrio sp.]MBX3454160.1 glycosyltransferase family 4 protein [Ferrovibrio sp.]